MSAEIRQGEALAVLKTLTAASVQCCVTSPPYFGLRSYLPQGHPDKALELGTEATLADYVARLVAVLEEIRRVLRPDGTLWLNLADSYAGGGGFFPDAPSNRNGGSKSSRQDKGSGAKVRGIRSLSAVIKPKNLLGVPWRVAFALQDAGWWLRSDIIWHKPNPMPESVTDRPTRAHEYLFLLSKSANYYYDADAIREPSSYFRPCGPNSRTDNDRDPAHGTRKQDAVGNRTYTGFNERWAANPVEGRNKRSVWTIATAPYPEAHFATFPEALVEPCILAGSAEKACEHCGAPWGRIVEKQAWNTRPNRRGEAIGWVPHPGRHTEGGQQRIHNTNGQTSGVKMVHRGWEPTCDCPDNHGTASSLVLDPFAGSGTVPAVATRLRRRALGIELNPDYLPLIECRIRASCPEARGQGVLALEEVS